MKIVDRIDQHGNITEHVLRPGRGDRYTLCGLYLHVTQPAAGNRPCRRCLRSTRKDRALLKRAERMLDRFLPMAFIEYERMYPGEVDPANNYVAWEVQEARDVLAALEAVNASRR